MQFSSLMAGLASLVQRGDAEICGISHISSQVQPGFVFVAIKGQRIDGHDFIADAVARGAAAVVVTRPEALPPGLAFAVVLDARVALTHLSSLFFESPAAKMRMIGVTGTNGKTTTAFLIQSILRAAGVKTGLIGTVCIDTGDAVESSSLTTPDAPQLYGALSRMVENARTHAVMEVSSHALALGRVEAIEFDTAVFLNLTQDHLDLHHTMENYFQAKAQLFTGLKRDAKKFNKTAIINIDDEYGRRLRHMSGDQVQSYALDREADLMAADIRSDVFGAVFLLKTPVGQCEVRLSTPGRHSIYNALAATGAALAEGVNLNDIVRGLSMPTVPGRMERVLSKQGYDVFVDYAHTPDGLENVLKAARGFTRGRLIVVFGCGGDRDKNKRPIMGAIAARLADIAIITSDNPRSEDPHVIIKEILAGIIDAPGQSEILTEADRQRAIRLAISLAKAGDVILLAGKGHETYQIFADRTIHFDDREEASLAMGGGAF